MVQILIYMSIGLFLCNHYDDALNTISQMKTELNAIKGELGITDDEFEQYLKDERKYLQELTEPSTETTLKIQYIRALRDLFQCK
jgi:hypothetical protein